MSIRRPGMVQVGSDTVPITDKAESQVAETGVVQVCFNAMAIAFNSFKVRTIILYVHDFLRKLFKRFTVLRRKWEQCHCIILISVDN
jgi:hypothetical protein